jgi:hypothetical protein
MRRRRFLAKPCNMYSGLWSANNWKVFDYTRLGRRPFMRNVLPDPVQRITPLKLGNAKSAFKLICTLIIQ